MIRNSARVAVVAVALFSSPFNHLFAQDQTPASSPTPQAAEPGCAQASRSCLPWRRTRPTSPRPRRQRDVVNAFMQANLGFDSNSMWQVQAIQKTPITGITKVIVFIGDKTGKQQPYRFAFFTAPDQQHIIVGDRIMPFGEHPFAEYRTLLQQKANGPYRGSASKDLELVEFADFQCPHCKAAQANMDKLVADFPKARIVFQNDPLPSIHPESVKAAAYGVGVAKLAGSTGFFQFADAVFEGQDGLATADGATLTLNSSTSKAGLEPAKVAACGRNA